MVNGRLMEHQRNQLAEDSVSICEMFERIDVFETYQARFAGVVSSATHGPAFAVPCGEVVAAVAV